MSAFKLQEIHRQIDDQEGFKLDGKDVNGFHKLAVVLSGRTAGNQTENEKKKKKNFSVINKTTLLKNFPVILIDRVGKFEEDKVCRPPSGLDGGKAIKES